MKQERPSATCSPTNISDTDRCIPVCDSKILLLVDGGLARKRHLDSALRGAEVAMPVGDLDGERVFCIGCEAFPADDPRFTVMDIRSILRERDETMFHLASRAVHLLYWEKTHRFCGTCGVALIDKADDRARICPACSGVAYPRISPAIIVAVTRDDTILLARSTRAQPGFYSVLAGFVEPGETLEQCVAREVFEEVGITVKNIRYFGSQPWPLPDSLMIGFTAEYESGALTPDGREIAVAGWFSRDSMPAIPPAPSISRRLIDRFIDGGK